MLIKIKNLSLLCLLAGISGCRAIPIPPTDHITPAPEARLITLSREGKMASLDVNAPWEVKATGDLGAVINSVRCRAGTCVIVHPSPINALSIVNAQSLDLIERIPLEPGSDPRDVAFTDDRTLVVSLYERSYLLELNLDNQAARQIDLSSLADKDGLPEAQMLASCGKQVYVQLQRISHSPEFASNTQPMLAVIDTWAKDKLHTLPLRLTPALDMNVDCERRQIVIAEPKSIIEGGGTVEKLNLHTSRTSPFLPEGEFANGGLLIVEPSLYWINQHTDIGPGPSSHLFLNQSSDNGAYNVFATEHVDNIAYDKTSGFLYYPNPCSTLGIPECGNGVHVFNARTGVSVGDSIDPGFAPIEVQVSR